VSNLAIASNNTGSVVAIRDALKSSLYPGASDQSVDMVLSYCQAAQLDPMTKPVHIVPVWDSKIKGMRDVVMPGIGLYRTIAARTGCAGVSEPEFGPDVDAVIGGVRITYPQWCRVTVKRRLQTGEIVEFVGKELWIENYAVKGGSEKSIAPNAMWTKRPYGQIAKCAEAQALRKAFPEVGAQPTADEMEGKEAEHIIEAEPVRRIEAPKAYPQADFDANLPKWRELIESGRKTADAIVQTIQTKAVLTDEQIARIRACVVKAEPVEAELVEEGAAQ
jgi:phage recombination protein Bet